MRALVYIEHNNQNISEDTARIITAAQKITNQVDLLLVGYNCKNVAEQARRFSKVNQVLVADNIAYQYQQAENVSRLVHAISTDYTHILAASLTTGKNFMPRLAALLDVVQISDVLSIEAEDTFTRPIYAGNAIATVKVSEPKKVLTIRTAAFIPAEIGGDADIKAMDIVIKNNQSRVISEEKIISERPELTTAKVVVSGGRGMQNGDNFALLEDVADKLGAAIGASRAAVDAGFVSNDLQVGQTGKIVAPELYIAVGLSGAIQHLAGMKDSKIIVAINKDPDAPIHQVADYSLVEDLFNVLPELANKL